MVVHHHRVSTHTPLTSAGLLPRRPAAGTHLENVGSCAHAPPLGCQAVQSPKARSLGSGYAGARIAGAGSAAHAARLHAAANNTLITAVGRMLLCAVGTAHVACKRCRAPCPQTRSGQKRGLACARPRFAALAAKATHSEAEAASGLSCASARSCPRLPGKLGLATLFGARAHAWA